MVHISPSSTAAAPGQPEPPTITQRVAEGPSLAPTTGLPDLAGLSLNTDGGNVAGVPQQGCPSAPNIHITIHANASAVTINTGPTTMHPDLGLPNAGQAQLFRALAPFVAPPALAPARRRLQGGAPIPAPVPNSTVNRNVQIAPPPYVQQPEPAPAAVVQQPAPAPIIQQPAPAPIIQQPAPAPDVQQPALAFGEYDDFNGDDEVDDEDEDIEYIPASPPIETAPESPVIVGGGLADAAPAAAPFDFAAAVAAAAAAAANQVPLEATAPAATDNDEYIAPRDPDHHRWYVVTVGTRVGIWRSWTDMSDFVTGVPRNSHQHFRSRAEAEAHYYGKKANGEVIVVEQ